MTARQLAVKVLYEIDKNGAYTGIELKKQLSSSELSAVDKAFATELVYGVVKNRTRIDYRLYNIKVQQTKAKKNIRVDFKYSSYRHLSALHFH